MKHILQMPGHFQLKKMMTEQEEQRLYRVLFEDSDEEVGSEIYEIYDILEEVIENRSLLPQTIRVLH